ncbi:MAG: translation elongation factor EF-1 subunit alpha [Thermoproteota archaeon]|jgi:elongation factor 1-alpha|nr:translation elongation factor EF-1 subunit alpha [Thermoproteota archaeon]
MAEKKPHLNLIVAGHVDHGKSTTTGHILTLLGVVDKKRLAELEEEAKKRGKEFAKYAWILDTYKEERERDMTIDLTFLKFETKKYFFTIIDAPGHRDFVKNMVTGASQADAALLVVSAKKGEFEAGIGATGQTREHAFLLRTMGVNQIIVAINKMDDPSVNWSKERFEEVRKGILDLLRQVGYPVEKIRVIPISAWYGDNLVERSSNTPWYNGPTLAEAFDELVVPPRPVDKPLRIPVEAVYSITGVGTVPVGKVETGRLRVGDVVVVMPSGKKGEVRSIETHHTPIQEAIPGDNIGFNVKGLEKTDVKRGDVFGPVDNPPTVASAVIARIFVIYHPTSIAVGYTPVMHIHTATGPVKFEEIQKKLDPRTGSTIEENPKFIKQGDAAIVKLRPIKPMIIEKYSDFPGLGRFAIRDMGRTIAAGVVLDVIKA